MSVEIFNNWPYDEALLWMSVAESMVACDRAKVFIACGDHQETVITLGKQASITDGKSLREIPDHAIVRKIERGGGITAHEPGQIVLYPLFSLEYYQLSIADLVYLMEQAMIDFLTDLDIKACRSSLNRGVFIDDKKIGFVGLRVKNRIVSHGLAINVLNDAHIFSSFDPCGIRSLPVTSAKFHASLTKKKTHYMKMFVERFWHLFASINVH